MWQEGVTKWTESLFVCLDGNFEVCFLLFSFLLFLSFLKWQLAGHLVGTACQVSVKAIERERNDGTLKFFFDFENTICESRKLDDDEHGNMERKSI